MIRVNPCSGWSEEMDGGMYRLFPGVWGEVGS